MRFAEDGGEAVAQRVTAARVRLGFRRGGAPAARVASGAAAVSFRAEEARRQWSGEEEGASPAPLFIGGRGNCAGYHAARIARSARTLWPSCGRDSVRVCRAHGDHRISRVAHARDLRRQRGSGWERSLPAGSGQGA